MRIESQHIIGNDTGPQTFYIGAIDCNDRAVEPAFREKIESTSIMQTRTGTYYHRLVKKSVFREIVNGLFNIFCVRSGIIYDLTAMPIDADLRNFAY